MKQEEKDEPHDTEGEPSPKPIAQKSSIQRFLKKYRKFQLLLTPQQNLVYGFLFYTLLCWLLLCCPCFQKTHVSMLDNLFISTSAMSTTGLVTVSVFDSYNFFGQLIILMLIQFGGIGYMSLSSFIVLSNQKLTHWHQKVLGTEFSMPQGFQLRDFLKSVILFTFAIEAIGAAALFFAFKSAGVETGFAIWSSIFHSVSSFCTAGFGLYNNSFESFPLNTAINAIISVLSICGALGFIVVTDIGYRLLGRTKKITYTTKVIFLMFFLLLITGTVIMYCYEPSLANYHGYHRWMVAFFQAMTAITTVGFNTVPIGVLSLPVLLFIVFMMYIGASPSGTGGGMKLTTLTALTAILWSRIRAKKQVTFLGKGIPVERLYLATSIFILYTGLIFLAVFLLSFTENQSFIAIMFETASALGTVGLSMGITGNLTEAGKVIIILCMFIGRLGVITIGVALMTRRQLNKPDKQIEFDDLAV